MSPCCEDAQLGYVRYDAVAASAAATAQQVGGAVFDADRQAHVLGAYSRLHYQKMLGRTCIQGDIKDDLVQPLTQMMKAEVYRRLAKTAQDRETLEETIGDIFDVHAGIETSAKQDVVLRNQVKPVKPEKRWLVDRPDANGKATGPRRGDFVYDVPIIAELEAMLSNDLQLQAQLKAASDSWAATRPAPGDSTTVYADIPDGAILREHERLGVAADRSDGSTRLAIILYYDDLEVVNPLGAFHGTHKLGMFYWGLVNCEQSTRMAFHNLHLATIALETDIAYYGIEQVVSGLEGDTSFGSHMTRLDTGVHIADTLVRGWCVCLSADFPAAALCCGFKKSVSARLFCRECYVDQTSDGYPAANSFLDANTTLKCHCQLRDDQQMEEDFNHYRSLATETERAAFLQSIGLNTFTEHAFTRVPFFSRCTMVPWDFMHVELEGSLKNELAAMFYYFLRHRPGWGFTLDKVNAALRKYAWPSGCSPPTFSSGYLHKGTTSGKCKTGCHVHMTAGDLLIFVRHSVDVLLPLIGDTSDPLWLCWLAHVDYIRLLLKHSLTHDEVLELDRLIYRHHTLFLECTEYGARMFKPKNHFASHFARDILNLGPVRHYWCMRFEALNQLFKNYAKTGSFHNTLFRCSDFWTMSAAMLRYSGQKSTWGETAAVRCAAPRTYTRGAAVDARTGVAATVVRGLFSLLPGAASLTITWTDVLYYRGAEVHAGKSWVSACFKGKRVLAFIPEGGIFSFNGKFWFLMQVYPNSSMDKYRLQTCTVPRGYEPTERIVAVHSANLTDVTLLWPSMRVKRGTSVFYRFVPM